MTKRELEDLVESLIALCDVEWNKGVLRIFGGRLFEDNTRWRKRTKRLLIKYLNEEEREELDNAEN